ncbi:MAG: GNAT family N-acetyltransferase [Actinobacteria bacterium]|nr:GNAT family N-acetyltransferase [Actinomycetota bacterium]
MSVEFAPVITPGQVEELAELASEIWHEYFPCLLTDEQIIYMVDRFQSAHAISDQIEKQGYEYFVLFDNEEKLGYLGIQPQEGTLFLSKIYLRAPHRGKGYASQGFTFIEQVCRDRALEGIWLTVNRGNEQAVNAYKAKGFRVVREQKVDIGNGFFMDDYVMQKDIPLS